MIDTITIFQYINDLSMNNNREWFHNHKKQRIEATNQFESLVAELMNQFRVFDDQIHGYLPNELTFKMVRDTRFSHDKSPYIPAFRAHIGPKGKLPIPVGYFIFLKPDNESFIGGGLFADLFHEATSMIRDEIVKHGEELENILNQKEFKRYFTLQGNQLKRVPKGYDPEHPQAGLLKYKSWFIEYRLDDMLLEDSEALIQTITHLCEVMKPFNDFMNRALVDFKMPERP